MSVIGGPELHKRIFEEESEQRRLIITPLFDPESQIQRGSSSIDVRLGTHFVVQKRTNVSHLDPGKKEMQLNKRVLEDRIMIPYGKYFVLHPNQFALGATVEYLRMPVDLSGYLVGKSSWGRLGLIIATAVGIHPGFKGVITLELRNIGEVPIFLRPGRPIAQIFFHTVEGDVDPTGVQSRYIGAVFPESSQLGPDAELEIINFIGARVPSAPPPQHNDVSAEQ